MKAITQALCVSIPLAAASFYGGWKLRGHPPASAQAAGKTPQSAETHSKTSGVEPGATAKKSILTPPEDLPDAATATVASLAAWIEHSKSDNQRFWLESLVERIPMAKVKAMALSNPASKWKETEMAVANALFARWAIDEPASVEAYLLALSEKELTDCNLGSVLERWATSAPALGIKLLARLPKTIAKARVSSFAHSYGRNAPEEALSLLKQYGISSSSDAFSLVTQLAKSDPQKAAAIADRDLMGNKGDLCGFAVATTWAETDPDAALAWTISRSNNHGDSTAYMLLSHMAAKNPHWSLQALPKLSPRIQTMAEIEIVKSWATNDMEGAIAYVHAKKNKISRQALAGAVFEALDPGNFEIADRLFPLLGKNHQYDNTAKIASAKMENDAESAFLWLKKFTPEQKSFSLKCVVEDWMRSDPQKVLKIYDQLPKDLQENTVPGLAQHLADSNPATATEWIQALSSETLRQQATSAVQQFISVKDPESLLPIIPQITNDEERKELICRVASTLVDRDLQKTRQWAESLQGKERAVAFSIVVEALAEESPTAAAECLSTLSAFDEEEDYIARRYTKAIEVTAQHLYTEDPERAKAWSLSLTEGKARTASVSTLVWNWAQDDAAAVSEWVAQLQPGPTRDAACMSLITEIAYTDPESAWAWAGSITDQQHQDDSLAKVAEQWGEFDVMAARKAVENDPKLTPEKKKELLKVLE